MPQVLIPTSAMVAHWGVFALYLSLIMALLRTAGVAFGPLLLKKSPGTYAFFAACWVFLQMAINDVFAALGKPSPTQTTDTEKK